MYVQEYIRRILNIAANTDGRFFLIVEATNNKTYQVKFNVSNQKSNINEFITSYIGKLINAPVLNGAFLTFTNKQITNIHKKINLNYPQIELDMSDIKNNQFFGIEWQDSLITLETNSELEIMLTKINNKKEFYSLYPYDQYLKNYDRHIGNHLILKDGKNLPSQYCLIDGDRIFGSLYWNKIEELTDNFSCLEIGVDWHKYLYGLVTENEYIFVLEYSLLIDEIKESDIETLVSIILSIYNVDKKECAIIKDYLEKRSKDFYAVCLNNSTCFPQIIQRRLG
ncbi:MAG: hypothetical protein C0625_01840 [Arcobacter sp.]|nr:MAG: hypothetical protein C0625_01840 [Arcobacter sp.]